MEFVIISSGTLAVRGIREANDIDLIVTEKAWKELIKKYPVITKNGAERIVIGNEIEISCTFLLLSETLEIPVQEVFDKADIIDGIKYMNLEHVKIIKRKMNREKDLKDIALIDAYLKQ